MDLEGKKLQLEGILRGMDSVLVAYSGGIYSALLSYMAHRVLGGRMLAVTAQSPSVARAELEQAVDFARRFGIPHRLVPTREVENPDYARNPVNRCFYCKEELYSVLTALRQELQFQYIADGSHAGDRFDDRPGMAAAVSRGVRSPLREAGLIKSELRDMAKELGLSVWDKPSSPCLSSRVPHGIPITPEKLSQVDRAESVLRGLGFKVFRVRHHDELARIEVAPDELARLLDVKLFEYVAAQLRNIGYRYVTLDMQGYRSGDG